MITNQFPFNVLFCFENDNLLIIEIKRTDIQSEDKRLVYKWLRIQKQNENENESESESETKELISQLTFQSMDASEVKQVRVFAEGILEWNALIAHFNEVEMKQINPELLAETWKQTITEFLA